MLHHRILRPIVITTTIAESYDFVIVGGRTAGLVLAYRLFSNSACTAAVVEAGDGVSAEPRVRNPRAVQGSGGV